MDTLSQRLAKFASELRFDDLPAAVVDKAKAALLHNLIVGLASLSDPDVQLSRLLVLEEAGEQKNGARLIGFGDRTTRSGAGFANSVLIHSRSQDDSFRMLTHPGSVVLPAALAESDGRGVDGRRFLTALVAGYEIQCRLAREFIPSVQNHGFRSSALFGIFGPTVAAAKLANLGAGPFSHALALAVGFAFGSLETGRAGTREMTYQEPQACRAGLLAAGLAAKGVTGASTCFEGAAGFYYSFTGSADGALSGSFENRERVGLAEVAGEFGSRWDILGVTMKIYSAAGYTQPVIESIGRLAREHNLSPRDVREIQIEMNEWEAFYPSRRFPKVQRQGTDQHSTAMLAASALAAHGYPVSGRRLGYGEGDPADEPADVRELAQRTRVVAAPRPQYAPRITLKLVSGATLVSEMTGDEFKWDFATVKQRTRDLYPALLIGPARAEQLAAAVEQLEQCSDIDELIDLTLPAA